MMNDKSSKKALELLLAQLPHEPGVYQMLNALGDVLYVGKAADLHARVNSYFKKQVARKTRSLVSQIVSINVSVTRTEMEALLLESNLIKALRPKYNVLLRDDKSYPYIHISEHAEFPRMDMQRSKKKPLSGHVFGPFPNSSAVKETLVTLQKVFKIRNCSDAFFNSRSRPCLQYQIKRCTAPCVQYITPSEYQQSVSDAVKFLQGKSQIIIDELAQLMEQEVQQLHFEEAARLRDRIKNLRMIQEQQGIIHLHGDADVIAIEAQPGFACIQCVTIREGKILFNQHFFPQVPLDEVEAEQQLWEKIFEAFISFYYLDVPERIPPLIITNHTLLDHQTLQQALSTQRKSACIIRVNPRGVKARWMDFAENNLRISVMKFNNQQELLRERYRDLEKLLSLKHPIRRMECFDISHTQGQETVASCVVFNQEGACPQEYRRFNIAGITPGDDYAAMEQALIRRFKRLVEAQSLPSLLIIDGGKGQVAVAKKVLDSLNCSQVMILGVAKGPLRKAGLEKLILPNQQQVTLNQDAKALHLIQQIRDEAHRFAITAHRKKRQKRSLTSSLEEIEAVGPKRRRALLNRFGGIRELAKAPLEEIEKIAGISKQLALRIYQYFHGAE